MTQIEEQSLEPMLDVRLIDRYLQRGVLSQQQVEEHLAQLKDVSAESDWMTLENLYRGHSSRR